MRTSRHDAGGFTLMELLVVITIIGILATIVTFSVSGLVGASNEATCSTQRADLKSAEEAAIAANGAFLTKPQLVAQGYLKHDVASFDVQPTATGFDIAATVGGGC